MYKFVLVKIYITHVKIFNVTRINVNIALSLNAYEKLVEYNRVLGLNKSMVINFLLKHPTNGLVLELAYQLVKALKESYGR